MNMNHDNIANIVSDITQRSVLLSTKIRNAHIQLVSQSNKVDHHQAKLIHLMPPFSSSFFETKKSKTSLTNNKPKIKHSGHEIKFIATAIVSGDNRFHENTDQIPNQNDMNACRK